MIYFDVTIANSTAPSCFFISVIGNSTGTVMIETSPFVNVNYFERREVT